MFFATPVYRKPSEATRKTVEALLRRFGGQWVTVELPWVGNARSELAGQFLESGEPHCLWIDADISFAPEVVDLMLAAAAPIITCTYRRRKPPHGWAAQSLDRRDLCFAPERILPGGKQRVIEIASDGFGCVLVRRDAIERMCRRYRDPWRGPKLGYVSAEGKPRVHLFAHGVETVDGRPRAVGEDTAFFLRARACGFTVECLADATIVHDGIRGCLGATFDALVEGAAKALMDL
ncbi:MAG TPA: hypothetical protein VN894_17780 [Polyangiaceae bacterium]|nr:hypothetical protein [Polyangiaceae bacterium]